MRSQHVRVPRGCLSTPLDPSILSEWMSPISFLCSPWDLLSSSGWQQLPVWCFTVSLALRWLPILSLFYSQGSGGIKTDPAKCPKSLWRQSKDWDWKSPALSHALTISLTASLRRQLPTGFLIEWSMYDPVFQRRVTEKPQSDYPFGQDMFTWSPVNLKILIFWQVNSLTFCKQHI